MKVLKFGGTSVGSAARMRDVAKLICDGEQKIVVLSAMSGTTNNLVEISDYLYKNNISGGLERINVLEQKYIDVIEDLFSTPEFKSEAKVIIKSLFEYLRSFSKSVFTLFEEKAILAQGELLSTTIFQLYLNEIGEKSALLPALWNLCALIKTQNLIQTIIAEILQNSFQNNRETPFILHRVLFAGTFMAKLITCNVGEAITLLH
jgi:aspartate kinase